MFRPQPIESALDRLKSIDCSQHNKDLITKCVTYMLVEGLSHATIVGYIYGWGLIAMRYGKPLDEMSEPDMMLYFSSADELKYADSSIQQHKRTLQKLFNIIGVDMRIPIKNRISRKLPDDLLTHDEIISMINSTNNLRNKAIIATLYDSGARVSEIGGLLIKHVTFDKYGAVLVVDGKTGMRRVRLVMARPYIANWLTVHPDKDNPEAPLWPSRQNSMLSYSAMFTMLRRVAKAANVQKRIYPHLFRHSRSTELASHLTQSQMEQHLGWVHGSNMPAVYIHMSGKETDSAILKMHGVDIEPDDEPSKPLTARKCPTCGHINAPDTRWCGQCGSAMTEDVALEADEQENIVMRTFLDAVTRDPNMLKLFHKIQNNKK
ncbi:MAG: tyrosine-type recombinase/integrase [Methanosarcinaceae archaeon]